MNGPKSDVQGWITETTKSDVQGWIPETTWTSEFVVYGGLRARTSDFEVGYPTGVGTSDFVAAVAKDGS